MPDARPFWVKRDYDPTYHTDMIGMAAVMVVFVGSIAALLLTAFL